MTFKHFNKLVLTTVALAAALTAVPSAASAAPKSSFTGSCELSGVATFDRPATNAAIRNGATFRSQRNLANCLGTLEAGGRDLGFGRYAVRAYGRGTGTFSCVSGTLNGAARLVILRANGTPLRVSGKRVVFRAGFELRHAVAAGGISYLGAAGTRAEAQYNFIPSVSAVTGCGLEGDVQLPMVIRMQTIGVFTSR